MGMNVEDVLYYAAVVALVLLSIMVLFSHGANTTTSWYYGNTATIQNAAVTLTSTADCAALRFFAVDNITTLANYTICTNATQTVYLNQTVYVNQTIYVNQTTNQTQVIYQNITVIPNLGVIKELDYGEHWKNATLGIDLSCSKFPQFNLDKTLVVGGDYYYLERGNLTIRPPKWELTVCTEWCSIDIPTGQYCGLTRDDAAKISSGRVCKQGTQRECNRWLDLPADFAEKYKYKSVCIDDITKFCQPNEVLSWDIGGCWQRTFSDMNASRANCQKNLFEAQSENAGLKNGLNATLRLQDVQDENKKEQDNLILGAVGVSSLMLVGVGYVKYSRRRKVITPLGMQRKTTREHIREEIIRLLGKKE